MIPMSQNKKFAGTVYYNIDRQVLKRLDPYATTSQATHRPFAHNELLGYPAKDAATYWDCEGRSDVITRQLCYSIRWPGAKGTFGQFLRSNFQI